MNTHRQSNRQRAANARHEQGWVLLATVILAATAASLTVTWARHAVLQKSELEMASGASEAEESARSGMERTREKMRRGQPPGTEADGEEEVVETETGDIVICERAVEDHEKRRLRTRAHNPDKDWNESANSRARCRVQPASGASEEGNRTRLDCTTGAAVLSSSDLIVISGSVTYTHQTILGVLLLEPGAELTLDKCVIQGGVVSRAGLCEDTPLAEGSNRPRVNLLGGTHIHPGYTLKDIAILAPDADVVAASNARINLHGFIAADTVDFDCRGVVHDLVVAESSLNIGPKIVRPGSSRGPRDFPDTVIPGAELMTSISFPTTDPTEAQIDLMEQFDA